MLAVTKNKIDNKPIKRGDVAMDLEARFLDGERLSVEDVLKEYFATNQYATYLKNLLVVRGIFSNVKRIMTREHGLWFGRLNDLGQYGVIESEEEAVFVITKYYNLVKGNIRRVIQVRDEAQNKGILPTTSDERFLLPKIVQEEKDN